MSPKFQKAKRAEACWTNYPRSVATRDLRLADNETQASETKCTGACWTNYTRRVAPW